MEFQIVYAHKNRETSGGDNIYRGVQDENYLTQLMTLAAFLRTNIYFRCYKKEIQY